MSQINLPVKTKMLNAFRQIFKIPFLEKWLLQSAMNKSPDDFFQKLIPPNYLYAEGTMRTAERDGILYQLDLFDYVEHTVYWGVKDSGHANLYNLVKEGMVILDVGANIGDTALHFSKIAGNEGRVICFEPDLNNFKKLSSNVQLNKCSNIILVNAGLGNENKQVRLFRVSPDNKGMNRILDIDSTDANYSIIEIKRADDVMKELKIEKADLIKIDVEGFEFEVLKGAEKIISISKPILFIEIDDNNLRGNNTTPQQIFLFLKNLGYKIINAQDQTEISGNETNWSGLHFDVICTSQ